MLEKVAKVADQVLTWWIVTALVIMVSTIVCDVILRGTVSYSLTWNLEVAQYCLINLTYVGAALAYRLRAHISISTATSLLPRAAQKWVEVVARFLVLPFLALLVLSGVQILQKAKGVTPSLHLPIWVYYFPVFIGSVLLCFYGVLQLLEAIQAARSEGAPAPESGVPRGAV